MKQFNFMVPILLFAVGGAFALMFALGGGRAAPFLKYPTKECGRHGYRIIECYSRLSPHKCTLYWYVQEGKRVVRIGGVVPCKGQVPTVTNTTIGQV